MNEEIKELLKEINKTCMPLYILTNGDLFCQFCSNYINGINDHDEDCIVFRTQQLIKEYEEKYG